MIFLSLLSNESQGGENTGVARGGTLDINRVASLLDLSSYDCDNLTHLCAYIYKNPNSTTDFTFDGFTVCETITCIGAILTNVTVSPTMVDPTGFPLRELVLDPQEVRLDVAVVCDDDAGGIFGSDLWSIEAFFSRSENCTPADVVDYGNVSLTDSDRNMNLEAGESAEFSGINVSRT